MISSKNLMTGRQLRAARVLAGMTQKDLAAALGINERAVRFWERKHDRRPTSAPNDARIEQALLDRGVVIFAEPTPGARLAKQREFFQKSCAQPKIGYEFPTKGAFARNL